MRPLLRVKRWSSTNAALVAATSQKQSGWNGAVGMERKVPFPQSKEEAGVLRRKLAVRAIARVPSHPFYGQCRQLKRSKKIKKCLTD